MAVTGYTTTGSDTRFSRGMVALDSFAGANDNAKMTAAMSFAGSQTYPPYIFLDLRQHTFTSGLGQPYDGFGMVGVARGWSNVEKGNQYKKTPLAINIGANTFLNMASGDSWNWHMEGFQITGNSTSTLVAGSGGGTLWASTFRNMTVQNLKGVFGNGSSKLLLDLCTVDGQWEILNCYDTYVNVGGGDVRGMFSDGGNFGCGSVAPPSTAAYQMIFSGYSKGWVGPVYISADNGWRGMKITGSQSNGYGFDINQAIIEGRNNGSACDGNLLRIEGGSVNIFGGCINNGMVNPQGTEHGLIEITGSGIEVSIFGTSFAHASAASGGITTPCVYVSGSAGTCSVGVHGLKRASRSGNLSWGTQRPVVDQTTTGLVLASDSFCSVI